MTGTTVTWLDLMEAVCRRLGLSRAESLSLVGQALTEICDTLAAGERVKLSLFGTFTVRGKAERWAAIRKRESRHASTHTRPSSSGPRSS